MESEFIYFSYTLYMIKLEKRERAIDWKTAINVAQNLPDADSRCVYFTCKYYSMTRDRKHPESLKCL